MPLDIIEIFDHGTGPIEIEPGPGQYLMEQMHHIQLHHKSNGALDDTPSFCFVMANGNETHIAYAQISLRMLNKALLELGYMITETEC